MYKNTRIFLGTAEVAGFFENLDKGFKRLGIKCDFYCLYEHSMKYSTGNKSKLAALHRKIVNLLIKTNNPIIKVFLRLVNYCIRLIILVYALISYDVFIFLGSGSIWRYNEYPVYWLFRKKTIFIYCGSDSRPTYLNGAMLLTPEIIKNINHEPDIEKFCIDIKEISNKCNRIKKQIRRVEKYADYLVNIYPQAVFHQRDFISLVAIGWPFECSNEDFSITPNFKKSIDPVRILHAPSRIHSKGSATIRMVIKELKEKGHNIEYIEISNRPHDEVIEVIQRCDMVVDELYSDTPLGALGTEAAFFKKPVVVGGYYANYIHQDELKEAIAPSCYCHPDKIKEAIERYILNPELRRIDGERLYEYCIEYRQPEKVAERILKVINGDSPKEWLCRIENTEYFLGYGLNKDVRDYVIRTMIKEDGVESLCLSDNKIIENKILKTLY